jgi:uncharacterized membrane protein
MDNIIIIVIISVFTGAFGQIYFKKGINNLNIKGIIGIIKNIFKVFLNSYILFGLLLYALSSVFWLYSMTKLDISLMYPLTSLGYFITAIFASKILKERIKAIRWLGISLIFVGSIFIMQSI